MEIRREYILEDAFKHLYPLVEEIKEEIENLIVDFNYMAEEGS